MPELQNSAKVQAPAQKILCHSLFKVFFAKGRTGEPGLASGAPGASLPRAEVSLPLLTTAHHSNDIEASRLREVAAGPARWPHCLALRSMQGQGTEWGLEAGVTCASQGLAREGTGLGEDRNMAAPGRSLRLVLAPAAGPGTAWRQVWKTSSGFSSPSWCQQRLPTAKEQNGEGGSTLLL